MTRVDFYILQGHRETAINKFACKIATKAYQNGNNVYIHNETEAATQRLDKLLWIFQDISFIPHCICDDTNQISQPVLLGFKDIPEYVNDVCINLTQSLPKAVNQFKRIIEIIPEKEEHLRQAARKRYSAYRDNGCELITHKITHA